MSVDDELEEVRKRRLLELRRQLSEEQQQTEQQKAYETQKEDALRNILTYEARQRLNRLRLVKSTFVEQVELQLIQIAQTGKIQLPIDDGHLKQILEKLQPTRKEITFRRV